VNQVPGSPGKVAIKTARVFYHVKYCFSKLQRFSRRLRGGTTG